MYLFTKKKIFSFTIITSMLLTGCGGGSSTPTDTQITQQETEPTTLSAEVATQVTSTPEITTSTVSQTPEPTTQVSTPDTSSVVVQKGQVKDSKSGVGLANVKVSIGEQSTLTDASGFYTLSNLPETEEVVVNFEKEGYLLGSTQIQLKSVLDDNTTSPNYLVYSMYAHDYQWNIDSREEISSSRIAVDASTAYIDTKGNSYNGTMTAQLTILDNGEESLLTNFPGTFKGINSNGATVQFETYGLITLLLSDTNGSRLSLAEGETVSLTFKANASPENPSTLPLWHYDDEQGLWFEEGYAELQEDGMYKGEVSHLGTWSLNKPLENEPGIYRARIIYPDGTAAKNVRIQAIGTNWINSDLSTDEEGIFEIEVIPDSEFKLKAYDYKNKFGATSAALPALTSGEVNEDRI